MLVWPRGGRCSGSCVRCGEDVSGIHWAPFTFTFPSAAPRRAAVVPLRRHPTVPFTVTAGHYRGGQGVLWGITVLHPGLHTPRSPACVLRSGILRCEVAGVCSMPGGLPRGVVT